MRIRIDFKSDGLELPRQYYRILQAMFYGLIIDDDLAMNLHDSTEIKYFNFSNIKGEFKSINNFLHFNGPASIEFSTVSDTLMLEIVLKLLDNMKLHILDNDYEIIKIKRINPKIENDYAYIEMISPLTVHITDPETKYTTYFNPGDEMFNLLINKNFNHKYDISGDNVYLDEFSNVKKIITKYKGIIIEGYKFKCRLNAKREYIEFLHNTGLGTRNSYGFGMFRIINDLD